MVVKKTHFVEKLETDFDFVEERKEQRAAVTDFKARPTKAPRSFAAMLDDIKKRFPKTLAYLAK